jgi:putative Holliday junction resolvase
MRGRRIAFDYGDTRIGVAICDPDGILATPLQFLDSKSPKLMREISLLVDEYQPIAIYLGKPVLLSGEQGAAVQKVETFASALKDAFPLPIHYVDERLSTVEAQRKLREGGKSTKNSRHLIDSMAAVAILEAGLAHEDR